jgi:hypothetical protein
VVCRNFRHTTQHGSIAGKTQDVSVKHYNLDVIISVGYRVKSFQGTQFRIWATERLKEYIIKGFTMDDERLKILNVTAAAVYNYVNKTLFEVLPYPAYQTDDIDLRTNLVYEHLKNQYFGGGMSIYGSY